MARPQPWWLVEWQRYCASEGKGADQDPNVHELTFLQRFLETLDRAFKASGSEGVIWELNLGQEAYFRESEQPDIMLLQHLQAMATAMASFGYFGNPLPGGAAVGAGPV